MSFQPGMSVGLFGGSFNPAHAGHLHVAMAGLRELQLDRVLFLVSPQNPLKPEQPPASERAETVDALGLPFSMKISHLECKLQTQYTVDLLKTLKQRAPNTRFVYLIGSDNLAQMPRWKDWRTIFDLVPIAVIARPGESLKARLGPVARRMAFARIPEHQAHTLQDRSAPAWTYLTLPLNPLSSTALRRAKATA